MSNDFAGTFDRHEIRDCVIAPHFGSWRLMRRTKGGSWEGVFWCRITAADGLLRVSGDFAPIVFRGHLSHEDDPVSRVAWMGARKSVDCYVREKASTGTGGASYSWATEDACADLRELIADREKELAEEREEEDGEDEYEVERLSRDIEAFKRGAEWCADYSGEPGCVEIMQAVLDYEPDPLLVDSRYVRQSHEIESEVICEIGRRPSNGLKLAHLAVQRLHVLLTAQAVVDAAAESADVPKNVLSLPEGYKHSQAGPVPVDVDTSAMTGAQVVAAMNRVHGAGRYVWSGNAVSDTRDPTIASSPTLTFDVGAVDECSTVAEVLDSVIAEGRRRGDVE